MEIIELLADATIAGTKYEKGALLRVPKSVADELIASKSAKLSINTKGRKSSDEDEDEDGENMAEDEDDKGKKKKRKKSDGEADSEDAEDSQGEKGARDTYVKYLEDLVTKAATTPAGGRPDVDVRVGEPMWAEDSALGYGPMLSDGPANFLLDIMYNTRKSWPSEARRRHFERTQKFLQEQTFRRQKIESDGKGFAWKAVGSDEHSTAEIAHGGALVIPEYRRDVMTNRVVGEIARANGANVIPVTGGAVVFPITRDFDRSGGFISGVTVYRDHERVAATTSRAEFYQWQLTPQRVSGAGHTTGKLLYENPAFGGIVFGEMQKAYAQKMNREHIKGQGAGESMGPLNHVSTYSQTRVTSGRIEPDDIANMAAHCWDYDGAVWLAHRSLLPEILLMTKTIGVGGQLLMITNLNDAPQFTLLGRPLIFNEFNPSIGTTGDLMLVNYSYYMIGESGYSKQDSTQFVRYLEDQDTFRMIGYNIADNWWPSTLLDDSGFELSWSVALSSTTT